MRIALIDVDGHNFPNLPLMKLSAWHKNQGYTVDWYDPLTAKRNERKKEMAILNYTTTVDSYKTVSEIEHILVKHNAKSIMKNYDGESITGLSFLIDTGVQQIPVRLPVKIDDCFEVLIREKKKGTKNIKATREQAERVAWRILKDWVATQMALLDMQMAVSYTHLTLPTNSLV